MITEQEIREIVLAHLNSSEFAELLAEKVASRVREDLWNDWKDQPRKLVESAVTAVAADYINSNCSDGIRILVDRAIMGITKKDLLAKL